MLQNMGKGEEARKVVDALITSIGPPEISGGKLCVRVPSSARRGCKAWEAIKENYSIDDTVEKAGVLPELFGHALLGRIEEAEALITDDISIGANREDPQVRLSLCEVLQWTGIPKIGRMR